MNEYSEFVTEKELTYLEVAWNKPFVRLGQQCPHEECRAFATLRKAMRLLNAMVEFPCFVTNRKYWECLDKATEFLAAYMGEVKQ